MRDPIYDGMDPLGCLCAVCSILVTGRLYGGECFAMQTHTRTHIHTSLCSLRACAGVCKCVRMRTRSASRALFSSSCSCWNERASCATCPGRQIRLRNVRVWQSQVMSLPWHASATMATHLSSSLPCRRVPSGMSGKNLGDVRRATQSERTLEKLSAYTM